MINIHKFNIIFIIILILGNKPIHATENILQFIGEDRYFPALVYQYNLPKFIWEDFRVYNKKIWGDNKNGNIEVAPSVTSYLSNQNTTKLQNNHLFLSEGEMIWLLDRLSFGQVEFRWSSIGLPGPDEDKYIGFGDPNEGYAVGFRLYDAGENEVNLYAITLNQGQIQKKKINWQMDYLYARFIVDWSDSMVNFIIITPEKFNLVATFLRNGDVPGLDMIPKINLEISAQNFKGTQPIKIDLIKYDAYSR